MNSNPVKSKKTMLQLLLIGALSTVLLSTLLNCSKQAATPPSAQSIAQAEKMLAGIINKPDMEYPLPYRLYIPNNYNPEKSYPLILFLHSAGVNGTDNIRHLTPSLAQLTSTAQNYENAFVLAPQCPPGHKWVDIPSGAPYLNYSQKELPESDTLKMTKMLINELQNQYSINQDRLYVVGSSSGAAGAWDIITRENRSIFAAAITIAGAYDPSRAHYIAQMPIWIFHGANDVISPSSNMLETVKALKSTGSPVKYTEYPNVGHNSGKQAYQEENLYPWLFSQNLSSWSNTAKEQ